MSDEGRQFPGDQVERAEHRLRNNLEIPGFLTKRAPNPFDWAGEVAGPTRGQTQKSTLASNTLMVEILKICDAQADWLSHLVTQLEDRLDRLVGNAPEEAVMDSKAPGGPGIVGDIMMRQSYQSVLLHRLQRVTERLAEL